jgi:hypothetical protein
MSDKNDPPRAVRIDSWGFETGPSRRGNNVPAFGIFLIVFGLLLGAGQLFNVAALGASALLLALGVVLIYIGLRDNSDLALFAGILFIALAVSDMATTLNLVNGSGWGRLLFGLGLLVVSPFRAHAGKGWGWPLVLGVLFASWGAVDVATSYLNFDYGRLLGPALLVLLGIWLVGRAIRR